MPGIQHLIQITAQLESIVYPLVAKGNGLRHWWAEDVSEREGTDPPVHADWICETGKQWSGTHIIFRLAPGGPGTILQFKHPGRQSDRDYFISDNTTWGELMFRLKAAAEGKSSGPLFRADGLGY
jgi:hypothetical protein